MEIENWYNDPFNGDKPGDKLKEKKDLRRYRYGKLVCTEAHDGRKQKVCNYYYRNAATKRCLFLEKGFKCGCLTDLLDD